MKKILITGGAGYVGAMLTPHFLHKGHHVTVLDLMIFGENVIKDHKNLTKVKGDIRDQKLLRELLIDIDIIIHLACISNDPSYEMDPALGKSINYDSFRPLVEIAKERKVKRFIYASSSSVYGLKKERDVNESVSLEPLTDYSKFKAKCEDVLLQYKSNDFTPVIIRPATVCGFSPRQRLDLVVNILTNLAYHKRKISIFGGDQLRPNIHIKDMVRAYDLLVEAEKDKISGEIFNAGYENQTVKELANIVKSNIGEDVILETTPTDDNRSYHISSKKIFSRLGFVTKFTIKDAVNELKAAFKEKKLINTLENDLYFNIKKVNNFKMKL
jgi:nucleoside-diphosphate-sugar epimerase